MRLPLAGVRWLLDGRLRRLILVTVSIPLCLVPIEIALSLLVQLVLHRAGVMSVEGYLGGLDVGVGSAVAILMGLGVGRALILSAQMAIPQINEATVAARIAAFEVDGLVDDRSSADDRAGALTAILDFGPRFARLVNHGSAVTANGLVALGLATALLWIDAHLALLALVGMSIFGPVSVLISSYLRRRASVRVSSVRDLSRHIQRVVAFRDAILSLGMLSHERSAMNRAVRETESAFVRAAIFGTGAPATAMMAGALLVGILLWHSGGAASSGALLPFLYVFGRLVQALSNAINAALLFQTHLPYARTIYRRISKRAGFPARSGDPEDAGDSPTASLANGAPPSLEFSNVSFRHPGSRLLLDGVSLGVEAGFFVAVTGPNGSGKTSLLHLLLGIERPESGCVKIDGLSVGAFRRRSEAAYVGVVPLVVEGSLRANLLYGCTRTVADSEMLDLLDRLNLGSIGGRSSCILDVPVSEGGGDLSAGEKQKINLARVLLRRPSLLLLDEVTANLDAPSESEIVSILAQQRGRCTAVFVTHRPRLLEIADLVIDMGADRWSALPGAGRKVARSA